MVENDCSNQYKRDHMERWMFSISVESEKRNIQKITKSKLVEQGQR